MRKRKTKTLTRYDRLATVSRKVVAIIIKKKNKNVKGSLLMPKKKKNC